MTLTDKDLRQIYNLLCKLQDYIEAEIGKNPPGYDNRIAREYWSQAESLRRTLEEAKAAQERGVRTGGLFA